MIIFFWTPPHFWALALYPHRGLRARRHSDAAGGRRRRRDAAADPALHADPGAARHRALALGYAGALYGLTAAVAGAIMLVLAWQVFRERRPAERASKHLFAFSILYLFLLFAVLLVERGWGGLIARLAA